MGVLAVALATGTLATAAVTSWPRFAVIVVSAGTALAIAAAQPAVADRMLARLQDTALSHQGHAFTPGVHYKVLDPHFYRDRNFEIMRDMTWPDAGRYAIRALVAAVVVPLPWQAETRLLKAYLPEHVVWLGMCLLLPIGIWAAAIRHPAASFLMASYIAVMFTGVALVSGNVGTLVRHRGLVLPFVICLSAVAVCHLLARRRSQGRRDERTSDAVD
jgi:hypothetical protein